MRRPPLTNVLRPILISLALASALVGPGVARADPRGPISVMDEIEPDAAARPAIRRAAGPVTVWLNTSGGNYTPGEPNDSLANISSVPKFGAANIPPWDGSADDSSALTTCVRELFAPFGLVITEEDPGDVPHLEAVIGGDPGRLGLESNVAGVSPFLTNCGVIDDSIVFIFPEVVSGDPRRLCETVAQEVAHSFGLDHEFLCEDPMTYLTGCGEKTFLFQDSVCGEDEPRDCKCSRSQNSARMLLERTGRGESPGVWLNEPSSGDLLAAGFPVQAVVTRAPDTLELYVDGVLNDRESPADTGGPYQLVDFETDDAIRAGSHQVEIIARYGEETQSVTAIIEVEGGEADKVVSEGCAASGGGSGGPVGALLAVILLGLARRSRAAAAGRDGSSLAPYPTPTPPDSGADGRAPRRAQPGCFRRPRTRGAIAAGLGLAAGIGLAAGSSGCSTSVFGGPSGDPIESGCPTAGDVSSAIGVLWTPVAGTCTATLVGASAVVTAAHCVADAASAGDPIIAVFGARQFIAGAVELHPAWTPGAPIDDVAALVLTRDVEGIEPLSVDGATPAFGDEFTLIGHGEWSPDEVRDAERQAEPGAVSDLQGETFSYEDPIDEGCLEGRGGGWVVDASSGDLIGIHGEGRRIMRADQYACWLACGASPAALPSGCDCTRSDSRPCGDCGAEYLDWSTHVWSACEAAEELRPCEPGLTCDPAGACVP